MTPAQTKLPSGLVGLDACRRIVFPDEATAPCLRTFRTWKKSGFFPAYKIDRLVFADPTEVRAALEAKFQTQAA